MVLCAAVQPEQGRTLSEVVSWTENAPPACAELSLLDCPWLCWMRTALEQENLLWLPLLPQLLPPVTWDSSDGL